MQPVVEQDPAVSPALSSQVTAARVMAGGAPQGEQA